MRRIITSLLIGAFLGLFIGLQSASVAGKEPVVKTAEHQVRSHLIAKKVKVRHRRKVRSRARRQSLHKGVLPERHVPLPGSSGEEKNYGWYAKRAYPNDEIEPNAYANALAEARKLPLYKPAGKNQLETSLQWKPIGPYNIGGRVTAIVTHPTDSNTFYIGAANGGVWKTTNHGSSWVSLMDTFPVLSIGCMTLDPHDPNTIYVGMGESNNSSDSYPGNGVWRTIDAGSTWTYLGLAPTQHISKIIVDPTDKNIIYVCSPGPGVSSDSNRGIWKSVDYGATWTQSLLVRAGKSKTSTALAMTDLAMNPTDHNDLVAAVWQGVNSALTTQPNLPYNGLWRTRDGGVTWYRIDTLKGTGYVNGVTYKHLSRTSLLWTLNGKGLPTLYSVLTSLDKEIVTGYYLAGNFYGLYRTNDPESGWKRVLDSSFLIPFRGNNIDSVNLFNRQGDYNNFIVANPTNPFEIYIGGIDVVRSSDGGDSWKDITNAYPHYFANDRNQHSDMHALAFTASKLGNDLLNGQDGGIFNTRDYGKTWSRIEGLPITMFYHLETWDAGMANLPNGFPADSLKVMGGTQDNGTVAHGFTGNRGWDWINRGDGTMSQSDPNNPNHLITSLQYGKYFFRTTLDSLQPNKFGDDGKIDPNVSKWTEISAIAKRRGLTDSSEAAAWVVPLILDKTTGKDLYTARCFVYHAKLDFANPDSGTKVEKWSPQLGGVPNNTKTWFAGDIETMAGGVRDSHGRPMLWVGSIYNSARTIWRTTVDETLPVTTMPKWIRADSSGLPSLYPAWIVTDRLDSMTAYVGFSGFNASGHIYKTTNGGKKWKSISGNLPNAPINAFIINTYAETSDPLTKNQCIVVATDVGVFITTNGGTQWSTLAEGMPHLVVETITQYKNWIIVGTHGRSAWAIDMTGIVAQPAGVVAHRSDENYFRLAQIYPNPLNVLANHELRVTSEGNEFIDYIELMSVANGELSVTQHQIGDNANVTIQLPTSLSAGTYILRATSTRGSIASQKIIITR